MPQNIIITQNIKSELHSALLKYNKSKFFVLADENTFKFCYPLIEEAFVQKPELIIIPSGESIKNIETTYQIWSSLTKHHADRNSVLVNLGGGLITDIGGFAASTFKRGINFINIPTTLLGMIDASIGGKTGINLFNFKNQIGVFNEANDLIVCYKFLETLPKRELISGFAEMIKHTLIDSEKSWQRIKAVNPENPDFEYLQILIKESIEIKQRFVNEDPTEKGIREALNLGHTIGHAIETYFTDLNENILHGEAIAIGLIAELFLSNKQFTLDFEKLFEVTEYLATYFPSYKVEYEKYDTLYEIMKHDKKNKEGQIKFTLLKGIGKVEINQTCDKEDIYQALNYYYQVKK